MSESELLPVEQVDRAFGLDTAALERTILEGWSKASGDHWSDKLRASHAAAAVLALLQGHAATPPARDGIWHLEECRQCVGTGSGRDELACPRCSGSGAEPGAQWHRPNQVAGATTPAEKLAEALDRIDATIDTAERLINASPFWDEDSRYAGQAILQYPRSQIAVERAALAAYKEQTRG